MFGMNAESTPIEKLKNKNLIVFDGECVLCSGFFKFVVRADKKRRFDFSIAQSSFGEALYVHYGLKPDDYDTNLVFIDGKLYERLHAFFAVMREIGWPYKALAVLDYLPNGLLDWFYYKIARNRYQWFGKRDACLVPSDELKKRFIND